MREMTIEARIENLEAVTAFVDEQLEAADCPIKAQMQIDIAVEELFVNVAHYAYQPDVGPVTLRMDVSGEPLMAEITFIDRGIPFDPLKKADPDTALPAEARRIGGLGIFMVKKSMDDMAYERRDGQNILTIRKRIG